MERNSVHRAVRRAGVAMLALSAAPAVALAAEEAAGHGSPWLDLVYSAINLLILIAIIYYLGRKPIARALRGGAEAARKEVDEVRDHARRIEEQAAEQKRKLEGMQAELERMVADAHADAHKEQERMVEEAHRQAERLREQTRVQIEQEMNKARLMLRRELADETVRVAEGLLRQRAVGEQQQRLVEQYIEQIRKDT